MNPVTPVGYSGSPLVRKLGIREGSRVVVLGAPPGYRRLLAPLPKGVRFLRSPDDSVDLVHVFVTGRDELVLRIDALRHALRPDAAVWVSWPKKASKVPTTVTEDTVRELALPRGYVDVKVCAVTEIWSGLKLVVRKQLRPPALR
jgi:hypothetical protein